MEFFFEENSQNDEFNTPESSLVASHPTKSATINLPQKASSAIVERPLRKSRTRVAVQDDEVEFSNLRKSKRKTAPAKVRYLNTSTKIKNYSITPHKIGWLICFGLFLRLIFMDNGVIDFYRMESHMEEKLHSLELIKQENVDLITEIHRIKTESAYQKKLAREHLGVIAEDEYLILFAQESSAHSI